MNTKDIYKYWNAGYKDRYWYQECEQQLVSIFGQDQLKTVCNILAATSINTSLKSNITLFKRAYYEFLNDKEFSNYLPNIRLQLERLRKGKELSGRKIRNFAAAMAGNEEAAAVDIWMLRAFKMNRRYVRKNGLEREGGATKRQYDLIENYCKEFAETWGLKPREVHAMIWSGIRTIEGGDPQTRYTDILVPQYVNSLFPYKK